VASDLGVESDALAVHDKSADSAATNPLNPSMVAAVAAGEDSGRPVLLNPGKRDHGHGIGQCFPA
jgi:hypothetical protein